jgi:hypothetical protein
MLSYYERLVVHNRVCRIKARKKEEEVEKRQKRKRNSTEIEEAAMENG